VLSLSSNRPLWTGKKWVAQPLACVNDFNLLVENMNTMKKSTALPVDVSLEANAEKTEYNFMFHRQIAGQHRSIKIYYIFLKCG
jgi:hypothetical protein